MAETQVDDGEVEYEDAEKAAFYAMDRAEHPVTFEMMMERPETNGHSEEAIREGMEKWEPKSVDYGDVTAYHLDRETRFYCTLDREMYEQLRDRGAYIGEDKRGTKVHLSEDFRSVGRLKDNEEELHADVWGPLFPVNDGSELENTETATDPDSKGVMLRAENGDTVEITVVKEGLRAIPEKFTVVKRANPYHGPFVRLVPEDTETFKKTNYELTCPDRFSDLILWKAITGNDRAIAKWTKVAKVQARIANISGYDVCDYCNEPIKDPMHRSLAMLGRCTGGFGFGGNDGDQ